MRRTEAQGPSVRRTWDGRVGAAGSYERSELETCAESCQVHYCEHCVCCVCCEHLRKCYNFCMNTQKGFAPILIILLGVVVIGAGTYFYTQNPTQDIVESEFAVENPFQ